MGHLASSQETESDNYLLLAPGPVHLHPEVRRILGLPMLHHRTPLFDQAFKDSLKNLKTIFATNEPVYIQASTGSGGMESVVVNTLSPGDSILAIDSGKFGERWAEMGQAYGLKVDIYKVPWSESANPAEVEKHLKAGSYRAVLCQACETSTGALHPIRELGNLIAKRDETLFLVDGITALGAFPLPMDEWKIDGLVGGSQKAFMLPTGLSFVSLSKKAQAFSTKAKIPKYYFDLQREKAANDKGESFFSTPVALVRALDWVLKDIQAKGLPAHYAQIHERAEFTREFFPQLGFQIYPKHPGDSVTALSVPAGVDGQKLRAQIETKHNITIMGGQDQAKGKIIRIGHMGYIQPKDMMRLLQATAASLKELGAASDSAAAVIEAAGRYKWKAHT